MRIAVGPRRINYTFLCAQPWSVSQQYMVGTNLGRKCRRHLLAFSCYGWPLIGRYSSIVIAKKFAGLWKPYLGCKMIQSSENTSVQNKSAFETTGGLII